MFLMAVENFSETLQSIVTALTADLNITNVGVIIAAVLGSVTGLVLLWLGARKVAKAIQSAFSKGKISI